MRDITTFWYPLRVLFKISPSHVYDSPPLPVTCDQVFFFRRSTKEKQCETRRSVGGQSGFYAILSCSSEKRKKKKEHLIAGYPPWYFFPHYKSHMLQFCFKVTICLISLYTSLRLNYKIIVRKHTTKWFIQIDPMKLINSDFPKSKYTLKKFSFVTQVK